MSGASLARLPALEEAYDRAREAGRWADAAHIYMEIRRIKRQEHDRMLGSVRVRASLGRKVAR